MKRKIAHVVGLLKSWETGYISPSAQMAIKDAIALIEELAAEIEKLQAKRKKNAN